MTAKYVTTKDLAQRYSVHDRTIAKWVRCRILPVVKINARCVRFDVAKCDEILDRRTRKVGSVSVLFLACLSIVWLPLALAIAATDRQLKTNEGDSSAFVNRWSSVQI